MKALETATDELESKDKEWIDGEGTEEDEYQMRSEHWKPKNKE